ncbi:MAG TPA: hypothetical protein VFT70_07560 [Nocardioides sp.]|nr:hypothetical protein [Nocardioides sp.]
MTEDTPGVRRAWGWVAHLRAGGTTPWRDWTGEGEPRGRVLPGAQQLELLRRLNRAGAPGPALAARVLDASAPGRGRPDLELEGAVDPLAFGPPPVDPAGLPDDELLRVAANVLAEGLVASGEPDARHHPRPRLWRTRYRLVGDPVLADPVRAALVAQGRPPGGRGSTVLVLGTDVGSMVAHAWTARSLAEGAPVWRDWLSACTRGRALPRRVDLLRTARAWTDRVGPERVRIVLDPAELPRLVGGRRPLPGPHPLSADATDLARRIGQVLGLLVVPGRRRALVHQTLLPRLLAEEGPPLVVPPEHTDWLHTRAVRVRDGLLEAGYPVHGDPDRLLPTARAGVPEPSDAGVLALAMRLLLEKS